MRITTFKKKKNEGFGGLDKPIIEIYSKTTVIETL